MILARQFISNLTSLKRDLCYWISMHGDRLKRDGLEGAVLWPNGHLLHSIQDFHT